MGVTPKHGPPGTEPMTLTGLSDGERLGQAIERELTGILAEHRGPTASLRNGEILQINAVVLTLESATNAANLGGEIARTILKGLD